MSERSLVVKPDGRGLYDIKYEGGGPVPVALSGKYTSYSAGEAAIVLFQNSVRASPDIKYPKGKKEAQGAESQA